MCVEGSEGGKKQRLWIWTTEEVRSTQNLMSREPSSNTVDCVLELFDPRTKNVVTMMTSRGGRLEHGRGGMQA